MEVNTLAQEPNLHFGGGLEVSGIKPDESSVTPDVSDSPVLTRHAHQLDLEEGAGVLHLVHIVFLLDGAPSRVVLLQTRRVETSLLNLL